MRVTMTTFATLDGVVQAPGGPDEDLDGGFDHGGWMAPYVDDDLMTTMAGFFEAADAFLLGRRTYDIFAATWPLVTDPDDPIAGRLNALPKYVASTTLPEATWSGSTVLGGDVVSEVAALRGAAGRELQVHGSGTLAQTLTRHDLIDEYRVLTVPIVLGTGKRLFADGTPPRRLSLVDRTSTASGVDIAVYRPDGSPSLGAVGPEYAEEEPAAAR
ncbi:dihydrofolate reductase family protein [Nitriliruptor alkaliphilus]|uniref:dihydrofolate reductase family protein n=1 Tax=Nitriliruptor alkaliphilus TaxID=427918 RepID=UPI000695D50B|nr:dihydrofolate reductase family protein [Nitriliruptor alkaliphilus]